MKNLILFGLPGSGKSTVGEILAQKLNREFIDTDRLIEKEYGDSCRNLFRTRGEKAFRDMEKFILSRLSVRNAVIALGGGTLTSEEYRPLADRLGILVYLKCPIEILRERIDFEEDKPAYLDDAPLGDLVKNRHMLYESLADLVVETGELSPRQAADHIRWTIGQQLLRTAF